MLKIGLTGGIGSGKSTVARIFEVLGIPVYSADDAAKMLMREDAEIKKEIIDLFGMEAYVNEELNRTFISGIVFNETQKLEALNAIVHPHTLAHAEAWMSNQTAPYVIKEAALMFESEAWKHVDKIIGVQSPDALRISRVIARDQTSEKEVRARMSKQIPQQEKMDRCDFVVINDEQQLLIPQVLALHKNLIHLSKVHLPDG